MFCEDKANGRLKRPLVLLVTKQLPRHMSLRIVLFVLLRLGRNLNNSPLCPDMSRLLQHLLRQPFDTATLYACFFAVSVQQSTTTDLAEVVVEIVSAIGIVLSPAAKMLRMWQGESWEDGGNAECR